MNRPIAYIRFDTQFENLGDALINRELVRLVSPHCDVVADVSKAPESFVSALDLSPSGGKRCYSRNIKLRAIWSALMRRRVYYFFMPGGKFGEMSLPTFIRRMLGLAPYILLSLLGVRFIQVGASFERIGPRHALYLRARNCIMHRFYVRDPASLKLLGEKQVCVDGILPDLAFNIFGSDSRSSDVSTICYSFRVDQYPEQLEDSWSVMKEVTKELHALGIDPLVIMTAQVERDIPGMQILQKRMSELIGADVKLEIETTDIEKISRTYASCDLVISNRLHVLLLGGASCGRAVAVQDLASNKVSALFLGQGRDDLIARKGSVSTAVRSAVHAPLQFGLVREELHMGILKIIKA